MCLLHHFMFIVWVIKYDAAIEYFNDKPYSHEEFHQWLGAALMKTCDKKLKENHRMLCGKEVENSIKHIRELALIKDGCILDKNINVLKQEIDTKKY